MKRAQYFCVPLLALAAIGCTGADSTTVRLPIVPTASTAPTPDTLALNGEIVMTSFAPESGATMTVRDCGSIGGPGTARLCTDEFHATFDVRIDRDMRDPVLTVSFVDGPVRCAYAAATRDVLVAGRSVSFTPSVTFFSWEEFSSSGSKAVQPCSTPVTTTRMTAELWSDADPGVLKREFGNSYTFKTR